MSYSEAVARVAQLQSELAGLRGAPGNLATVEGNYENKVALNERSPSEPTGYVEMS